jgi:tRNA splicing endonuclease
MYYQVFIIILLILLYFYYRIFIDKKNIINVTNLNNDSFKREELLNKLKDFKKNNLELNKSDFYQQLNTLFRNYFTIL